MFMNGFTSIASEKKGSTECINFMFIEWTLDNKVKYVFGCIGTLLMGIFIQGISYIRIKLNKKNNQIIILIIYSIQMTLSYFLMLLAMTYSTELFCMVVIGLTIGYGYFFIYKDNNKLAENIEPCCTHMNDENNEYFLYDSQNNSDLNKRLIVSS